MNFGEELQKAISSNKMFDIHIFGYAIPVTDTVVVMWVIMAAIIIAAIIMTRRLETIPKGTQNAVEILIETINKFAESNTGHYWKHFAPYLGTVLIFLVISNIAAIFNIIPTGEQLYELTHLKIFEHIPEFSIRPPTRDINVTACMAIISILVVLYSGIRFKKTKGWLKSFIEPTPVMLPFKILDYFIRPLSLCFRLFGNILGALIIMELIYMVFPAIIPAALSVYFDLFDGILQAYVFVFLTSVYIAEAVE